MLWLGIVYWESGKNCWARLSWIAVYCGSMRWYTAKFWAFKFIDLDAELCGLLIKRSHSSLVIKPKQTGANLICPQNNWSLVTILSSSSTCGCPWGCFPGSWEKDECVSLGYVNGPWGNDSRKSWHGKSEWIWGLERKGWNAGHLVRGRDCTWLERSVVRL